MHGVITGLRLRMVPDSFKGVLDPAEHLSDRRLRIRRGRESRRKNGFELGVTNWRVGQIEVAQKGVVDINVDRNFSLFQYCWFALFT